MQRSAFAFALDARSAGSAAATRSHSVRLTPLNLRLCLSAATLAVEIERRDI
jgi:hypothetical protein